jgi:hypothetical protein
VLKLTAFLAGVRAYIEQTAPGMTVWESVQKDGKSYAKISPSEAAKADNKEIENVHVFYAPSGKALMIALSEDVLKRALDRQAAARGATQPTTRPWLGSSVAMRAHRRILAMYARALFGDTGSFVQARSWSNLPILNEWKRLYPNEDPVDLHKRIWGTTLVCPGGGQYTWNDQLQTMQSTVYGSPVEPKGRPQLGILPDDISSIDSGLTFEQQGLRARVVLEKQGL